MKRFSASRLWASAWSLLALCGCGALPNSLTPARSAVLSEVRSAESKGQGDSESGLPYMQNGAPIRTLQRTGAGKISHVVFIVQENRSFDDLFQGYPGADTQSYGYDSYGNKITLQPATLKKAYVIDHSAQAMFAACDGTGKLAGTDCRMDGFNNEIHYGGPKNPEYVYVPHNESKPYFDMAHEWVLADENFQSQLDESFVAHQYVIAAQAAWSVDLPAGAWGCEGGKYDTIATITKDRSPNGPLIAPCYDYQTLGDELDKAKLSWRFYASAFGSGSSGAGSSWSSYRAVKHIRYGPDWKYVIAPNWKFITDVRAGNLANFTWITPVCSTSDHVNCVGGNGPSWVAALVDTIGKSKFWNSTAIFVIWDDWGGLYDHVPPPKPYDRDSLGFRVPLLIVSPYAKQNYVSHVQYETASVLRFAEDLFGLGQLADADKRAASPANDCFDFSQKPRPFVKIKAPLPPKFFIHQPDEYFAPDYE
jgi:phospholipase C